MVKNWLVEEESGQGMVEYGLILALISVAAIVTMTTLGTNINAMFNKVSANIK